MRWETLQRVFEGAFDLGAESREQYLRQACGEDEVLLSRVQDLPDPQLDRGSQCRLPNRRQEIAPAPYEAVRKIGHGGMGAVYLAIRADDQYRKQVAITLMRSSSPDLLSRFRAERQMLANLEHPNVARLLDGGATSAGVPDVVMEYVDGVPLDTYCRRPEVTVSQILDCFLAICSADSYAHRNLIVHRDIKRPTFWVTPDGVPKLLDFGIAKFLAPVAGVDTGNLTQASDRLLTPDYASPEQVRGAPVTTATNLYLLGNLLFTILAGSPPFETAGASLSEMERRICETAPGKPSSVARRSGLDSARHLEGDLDNIILMAMRKEPGRRYAAVDGLAADVERRRAGFPVLAAPDSLRYRAGKFARRNRIAVTAAAAGLIVMTGFSVAMAVLAKRVAAERNTAREERPPRSR